MRSGPATLGDLAVQKLSVFCWCNRCGHWAVMETSALIAQLGPAMAVPRVASRLVCTGCGARDVATRPDWPAGGVVAGHIPLPPLGECP